VVNCVYNFVLSDCRFGWLVFVSLSLINLYHSHTLFVWSIDNIDHLRNLFEMSIWKKKIHITYLKGVLLMGIELVECCVGFVGGYICCVGYV